ncbi:MAG: alpha/beta hydrolase [Acidobacteriota bacterium]
MKISHAPRSARRNLRIAIYALIGLLGAALGLTTGVARADGPAPAAVGSPAESASFSVDVRGDGERHVLLIPGLGSPGAVWDDTVEALVADGFRTHTVTLAGFAGQPPLANVGRGTFLPRVHGDLLAYAQSLGGRVALVGHSLGAAMSLWLASSEPDQFGPVVAADGVPFLPALTQPDATAESARPQADGLHAMISAMSPEAYDRQSAFTLTTMVTDADEARRLAGISRGSDPASIGEAIRDLMTRDLRPGLAAVTAPVLLIGAGAPAATPEAAAELEHRYRAQIAAAPQGRVVMLPKARHFVMVDARERFVALTREHLAAVPTVTAPESSTVSPAVAAGR